MLRRVARLLARPVGAVLTAAIGYAVLQPPHPPELPGLLGRHRSSLPDLTHEPHLHPDARGFVGVASVVVGDPNDTDRFALTSSNDPAPRMRMSLYVS